MTGLLASTFLNLSQSKSGIFNPSPRCSPFESFRMTSTTASNSAIRHLICSCRSIVSSVGCSGRFGQLPKTCQHEDANALEVIDILEVAPLNPIHDSLRAICSRDRRTRARAVTMFKNSDYEAAAGHLAAERTVHQSRAADAMAKKH